MLTLEQAVSYHLQGNFYPPLPQAYVPLALEAIKWVHEGEFGVVINLPSDLNPMPRTAKQHGDEWYVFASDLYDALRLDGHKFGDLVAEY